MEVSEQFVRDVAQMRRWQKAFFASQRDSAAREEALRESRRMESMVDRHLREMRTDTGTPVQVGLDL